VRIKDYEFYHGAALLRLTAARQDGLLIRRLDDVGIGCYQVNGDIGVYIKYSTKRMSPWSFTFQRAHKDSLKQLNGLSASLFVLLVCHDDGVVSLDFDSAMSLLRPAKSAQWSISVERRPRHMYGVSGTGGSIIGKMADAELARAALFSAISTQ
jgi:hypothetical protein